MANRAGAAVKTKKPAIVPDTPAAAAPTSRFGGNWLVPLILVVTVIGLLDAAYLTYEHYNGLGGLLCLGGSHGHSSCQTVQSSTWSKLDGVPVALLGLIGYIVILAATIIGGELGSVAAFGTALVGFGFSMYLTYREIFTIKAICEWCVGSAIVMTILVVLTGIRVLRES